MSNTKTLRIGFLDMLTAFLCSSAVLMVIIAYSQDKSSKGQAYPRNFFEYTIEVSAQNIQILNGAELKFYINNSNAVIYTKNDGQGIVRSKETGLIEFETEPNYSVYVLGPQKVFENNLIDTYTIYVPTHGESLNDYTVGVLYYNTNKLGLNNYSNSKEELTKEIDVNSISITHKLKTLDIDNKISSKINILKIGEHSQRRLKDIIDEK
ncbi:hypothetical protein IMCC3317_17760 [Kordia antarctica]|uniref:Uncharacterized protein n=1 Tax=Kordia antarctica TaxID=1218801 RepID=A0A7L4ZI50_9FLAO|nr:hypothetical protein [Kordia antarctica]QHI36413.1 hypothetical protein IMCC3317_17760 [Kordia antarctica]